MRGSITQKNGRYYIVYYVGKKQKWEKVPDSKSGNPSKKNAERLLAQRITEINSGDYQEIKKITFGEFSQQWLRDYVDDPNHIKTSTAGSYHQLFDAYLTPHFGEYWLADVTADQIQKFVSEMGKRGLSSKTVQNILIPLTTMMKHAVRWGHLKRSPMPDVDRPALKKKEMAFLPPEEIKQFLDHVPEAWGAFFITAVLSGMRISELLAMKWDNLDMEGQQYHIKERLYMGNFDTPKRKASRRAVDLPLDVIEALRSHRGAQSEFKLSRGVAYQDNSLIFAQHSGACYEKTDHIRTVFLKALADAKCTTIRMHDLRHSYASLLIRQKASPKYIQKQLGHASIQITFDVYGHLMDDANEEVMKRLTQQVFGTA